MAGITVTGVSSTASQVNATFTIASSAATGLRNVTVTTAAGTSNTLNFTVNPSTRVFTPIRINGGGNAYTGATATFGALIQTTTTAALKALPT